MPKKSKKVMSKGCPGPPLVLLHSSSIQICRKSKNSISEPFLPSEVLGKWLNQLVKRQRLRGTTKFGNHKTKVTKFWLPIRKFRTCISNEIQNGIGSLSPLAKLSFSPKSNKKGGNWILRGECLLSTIV